MRHVSFALGLAVAAGACAQPRPKSGDGSSASVTVVDTVVGVVNEVGADPTTWMAVQPISGGRSLRLIGSSATSLRGVSGAEVWFSGARVGDDFHVDVFEVRKANGQVVDDGVVMVTQGDVFVRLRSGAQREVPNAPQALKDLVGARVWVSRPVADRAPSYGLIQRP